MSSLYQICNHHRSLCPQKFGNRENTIVASDEITQEIENPKQDISTETALDSTMLTSGENVFLQSAQTKLRRKGSGKELSVSALLDCASTRSYITEQLATNLQLNVKEGETITVGRFGTNKTLHCLTKQAKIEIVLSDGKLILVTVNVVPIISGNFVRGTINLPQNSPKIKGLQLADRWPSSTRSSSIDFLIGNDYYSDIMTGERILLKEGLYLLGSKLGWILSGRSETHSQVPKEHSMLIINHTNSFMPDVIKEMEYYASYPGIKPNLESFWDLETIGIKDVSNSTEDDIAQLAFDSTVKYENGRYQVCWPWKSHFKNLPQNYQLSLGRLRSTIKKLKESPGLIEKYDDIIKDQLNKKVIEPIVQHTGDSLKHYIPHFPVINLQRETTKVRIVYDASAKTRKDALSLNDCLYRGRIYMENLCGLLLRFRMPNIVLLSDIEKAFLQVGLQMDQRDVTRFLWIKNLEEEPETNNIQILRFCRVPFGMVSSPFLLGATIDHHLKTVDTTLANNIRSNIYMDNVLLGTPTITEAQDLYKEAKSIFDTAGMNLREWTSNKKEFMNLIPEKDKGKTGRIKVLGLHYDTSLDKMSVKFDVIQTASTKREVLHAVATIFDPLGLFSPFTLASRIFLQELWRKELKWDDPISNADKETWIKIAAALNHIPKIELTRQICPSTEINHRTCELHCFCDASLKAYCAVVYLKTIQDNEVSTNIIFAKARVAPKRPLMSIPRLELMSALIGIRCLNFVTTELHINIHKKILWSDSQCVLHWINSGKHSQVFVQNRLTEITKEKDVEFRYINTLENPADCATRSITPKEELSQLWLHGPSWLKNETWPTFFHKQESDTSFEKMENTTVLFTVHKVNSPFGIEIRRFSSLNRLLRVTALCNRFIKRLRFKQKPTSTIQSDELQESLKMWLKATQNEHTQKNTVKLYTDEEGIKRVITRLQNAEIAESIRNPVYLPKDHQLTQLIIKNTHQRLAHAGVNHTLSQLKLEFMIPQGRRTVKRYLKECITCKIWEGGAYKTPQFSPLPKGRVNKLPPFTFVGLDYFGPLYVKNQGKVWACIFTCLTVRAIHLELIKDMSADQFLMAFRRFIARRGRPKQIISDNAKQFKLSKSVIDKCWNESIQNDQCETFAAKEGITWSFILELAPWQGGFYERLIGIIKRALRKSLGRISLTFDQLNTMMQEIEAIINSRPITFVSDETDNDKTLTPAHFLSLNPKLGPLSFPVDTDILEDPDYMENVSTNPI